jgi:flagellar M-ring protein FliF
MDQLKQLLAKLSWNQRIWIGAAVLAVLGGLYSLNRWNQERDFKPLLTGLAPEDAGTVTAKLKELGVDYRLADGGSTIQVQTAKLAEMRLQLASAGLPKTGRIGFEIFDKANFGASEFAEQVNFNRAMEGELERSVMSIREVALARVHITPAKDSLYTEQREPAKASVLVQLRRASALSPQNIQAICQLMASAVPGLAPELVTVVDTSGNLLNRPRAQGAGADSSEATMDYRKGLEKDLQNKIAATLDPLVGADHFRVGASAEVDLSSGEQNEETYDPQKTVITNSQTTQDGPAVPASAGVPGTASNLPRPTAVPVPTAVSSSNYIRRTENISYQPSRVIKHVRLPQGAVRRLSLSVLVDHTVRWEGKKRIVEAPTADKLKVIRELVAAVAGLDTTRGDQLVVDAFPFEATLTSEPPDKMLAPPEAAPPPSLLETLLNYPRFKLIAGIGIAVLLLSVGGFIVLRRKSAAAKKKAAGSASMKQASIQAASLSDVPSTREELERQIQERLEQSAAEHARKEAEALMNLQLPDTNTKKSEVLTKHLTAEAKKDPAAVAQVIRAWLDADKHEY